MRSLREIQAGFAAALFNPAASKDAPGIRARGISPAVRLGFYRTNVFENYRKALSITYPAVQKLIGSGMFSALAQEYTRQCSCHSADVGEQGAYFAEFLSRHLIALQLPYLADVARLEWCLEQSFNEADVQPLPLVRLAAVPPELCEEVRFVLAPSTRLVSSRYPLDRIWQICQPDYTGDERISLAEGGVELLVRRDGYAVTTERLATADFAMLTALSAGYTFGKAFAYARSRETSFDPAVFLQRFVANGVLADCTLPVQTHGPHPENAK